MTILVQGGGGDEERQREVLLIGWRRCFKLLKFSDYKQKLLQTCCCGLVVC